MEAVKPPEESLLELVESGKVTIMGGLFLGFLPDEFRCVELRGIWWKKVKLDLIHVLL